MYALSMYPEFRAPGKVILGGSKRSNIKARRRDEVTRDVPSHIRNSIRNSSKKRSWEAMEMGPIFIY